MYIVKLISHECVCVCLLWCVDCPVYSSLPLTADGGSFASVMLFLNFMGVKKSWVITFYLHKFAETRRFDSNSQITAWQSLHGVIYLSLLINGETANTQTLFVLHYTVT